MSYIDGKVVDNSESEGLSINKDKKAVSWLDRRVENISKLVNKAVDKLEEVIAAVTFVNTATSVARLGREMVRHGRDALIFSANTAANIATSGAMALSGLFFIASIVDLISSIRERNLPATSSAALSLASAAVEIAADICSLISQTMAVIPVLGIIDGIIFAPAVFLAGVADVKDIYETWQKRKERLPHLERREAWKTIASLAATPREITLKELSKLTRLEQHYHNRINIIKAREITNNTELSAEESEEIRSLKGRIEEIKRIKSSKGSTENANKLIEDKSLRIVEKQKEINVQASFALDALIAWKNLSSKDPEIRKKSKDAIEKHYEKKRERLQNKMPQASSEEVKKINKKISRIEAKLTKLRDIDEKSLNKLQRKKLGYIFYRPINKQMKKWEARKELGENYLRALEAGGEGTIDKATRGEVFTFRMEEEKVKINNFNRQMARSGVSVFVNAFIMSVTITSTVLSAVVTYGAAIPVVVLPILAIASCCSAMGRFVVNKFILNDKTLPVFPENAS